MAVAGDYLHVINPMKGLTIGRPGASRSRWSLVKRSRMLSGEEVECDDGEDDEAGE